MTNEKIEIADVMRQVREVANSMRHTSGMDSGWEPEWCAPLRLIASALDSIDARLRALEDAAMQPAAKPVKERGR